MKIDFLGFLAKDALDLQTFIPKLKILIYYILHNRRFENHLPEELDEYIKKMMEDGEWDREPEIVAFSEVYRVKYNRLRCNVLLNSIYARRRTQLIQYFAND